MGNKKGSVRFSTSDKFALLKIVEEVLPIGLDEWEIVLKKYMEVHKELVDKENKSGKRDKKGNLITRAVTERTPQSLRQTFQGLRYQKGSTGL